MSLLEDFLREGAIEPLDLHFARLLGRLGTEDEQVLLGAALACRAPRHGHVCADLPKLRPVVERELEKARFQLFEAPEPPPELPWPEPEGWLARLRACPAVRPAGSEATTPLVLDEGALYLDLYWRWQSALARSIQARVQVPPPELDPKQVRADLDALNLEGEQRLAVAVAALRPFTVIAGGPGTGKTATMVRLLALLAGRAERPPRVALMAPTGKAAARMSEAIRKHRGTLPEALRARIPHEARTIHKRLGAIPGRPRFTYNSDNPLPADIVVVDEASMIDLSVMARVFEAVPVEARLVLLGDPDQLTSVEAGSVLGDICAAGGWHFSAPLVQRLAAIGERVKGGGAPGVGDSTVLLKHTWRFGPDSGIKALADAVNAGDRGAAGEALHAYEDVLWMECEGSVDAHLAPRVLAGYTQAVTARDPAEALALLGKFRILAPHRRGRRGVYALNESVERWLRESGALQGEAEWYAGRPIIVTRNDAPLGLFNGDVGITLPDEAGVLRVWFPGRDGPRSVLPARLPDHETVFATTVHKSQGSEYEEVALVLPEGPSPLLTRELLYTAITRASKRVVLIGGLEVLAAGVAEATQRISGLRNKL